MNDDKLQFVIDQLTRYARDKKVLNSTSTFILCPRHQEHTPSFRVFHSPATRSPGYGRCYGCGFSGPWDTWAEEAGLSPFKGSKPSEVFSRQFLADLSANGEEEEEKLSFSNLPEGKVWRSLKTDFLIEAGCRMATTKYGTRMVFMPVVVLGEQRGYIKARLRKEEGKPSYINKKGTWSRNYGLFPFDFALRSQPKVVVLVEGPRDSLRLNSCGIPTMSILGTQSWSEKKATLLDIGGVEEVIITMDGDCAGKAAIEKLRPSLEKLMTVSTFNLCGKDSPYWQFRKEEHPTKAAKAAGINLWDPGNMPMSKIRELKLMWKQHNGTFSKK